MKHHIGTQVLFVLSRARFVAAVTALLAISACATASIDDAVPVAATTTTQPAATPAGDPAAVATGQPAAAELAVTEPLALESPAASSSGPRDTGRYPNLNVTPPAAASILTPEETAAKTAEITAARDALAAKGGTAPVDEQARLRKLAETHAGDTLKQIEGK